MDWLPKAEQNRRTWLDKLEQESIQNAPIVTIPNRAPGWHEVGMEISCIPDAVYPWDPQVMQAIWKIAPDVVPVWIRWVFKDPMDNVVVFGRHGLARTNKDKKHEGVHWQVDMPSMPCQGLTFEAPNDDLMIWQEDYSSIAADTPGDFKPFSWAIYQYVADNYRQYSVQELKQRFIYDKKEARDRAREKHRQEMEYIQKDLAKFTDRKVEQAGELEAREYFLGLDKRKPSPKPFIHVRMPE